jgi:hypothetical protein
MKRSRALVALALLALPAALAAWHFAQPVEEPIARESPAPTPASAAPSAWGVVVVVPCHGAQIIASGDVVYGCRDRIDASTGRYLVQGTVELPTWGTLASIHGDLVVHENGDLGGWRVTRLSTGEEVQRLDFGEAALRPIGQHGDRVWWQAAPDDGPIEFVAFDLASMSRSFEGFRCASHDAPLFDANGTPTCAARCEGGDGICLQRAETARVRLPELDADAGDAYGAIGDGRLWVLKDGTLRWMNIDGTDDAAFELRSNVHAFGVLDATEDRVLAWLTREEDDTQLVVFSRDPHTNRWQASAPLSEPIATWGGSPIHNAAQILDSGRIAFVVDEHLYVLAEGGHLETPPPPSIAPLEGMVAMPLGEDGIYRDGQTEFAPRPTTAAMLVRPATQDDRARYVAVAFLHEGLFANLPAAELSIGLRNAVLPNGFSNRVRTWRENGARRWRMQTSQNDCVYDATAYDVLERDAFFEVRSTHFGSECQELTGEAAESCRNGDAVFGSVPADAEVVPGLPDSFVGDNALEP